MAGTSNWRIYKATTFHRSLETENGDSNNNFLLLLIIYININNKLFVNYFYQYSAYNAG